MGTLRDRWEEGWEEGREEGMGRGGRVITPTHRLGRHVDAHCKRLRGKQDLEQALLEKDLNHLLQNRQQTTVVDADATAQQWEDALNLQQPQPSHTT